MDEWKSEGVCLWLNERVIWRKWPEVEIRENKENE